MSDSGLITKRRVRRAGFVAHKSQIFEGNKAGLHYFSGHHPLLIDVVEKAAVPGCTNLFTMVAGFGRKSNLPVQFRTARLATDLNRSNRPGVAEIGANPPPTEAAESSYVLCTAATSSSTCRPPTNRKNGSFAHMAQRRYVVRPQISNSNSSYCSSDESQDELLVSGILDGITRLCLGGPAPSNLMGRQSRSVGGGCPGLIKPSQRIASHRKSSSTAPKKSVVYPIASYPARLNCQKLVSERREVFQQNLFRPVSTDDMSQYQSVSV
jgi:hypothetical protein